MTRPDGTTITPLAERVVPVCGAECLSHRCDKPCLRTVGHETGFVGHICVDCASVLAGWF